MSCYNFYFFCKALFYLSLSIAVIFSLWMWTRGGK